ncbi:hypothetical protein BCON_0041g00050 [Botryotinia convoluta]|uniref:Uncharacterized protein n=1 Tax=Botryotinia convoluta TaxID=54673 RepID=A0A4Z1IDR1_9HELO|nr:hypothetical protein BCON_0041g00050 [Botryotinia convoluta]
MSKKLPNHKSDSYLNSKPKMDRTNTTKVELFEEQDELRKDTKSKFYRSFVRRKLNSAFGIQYNGQNTTPTGANQVFNFQQMRRNTTTTSLSACGALFEKQSGTQGFARSQEEA